MKRLLIVSFFSIYFLHLQAQLNLKHTSGISEVIEIERLTELHKNDILQIKRYTISLDSIRKLKSLKIQTALSELDSMKKRRDAEMVDLKMGYFCSQCNVLKSVMEQKGENFEEHLKRVNGHPIPASDGDISQKRTEWTEKIAIKSVALNRLKEGVSNEELFYSNKIDIAKKSIDEYCKKIYELADLYTEKVFNEHKKILIDEINIAMKTAATEMIAWNESVLNQYWVDSIKQVAVNNFNNSAIQASSNKAIKEFQLQQHLKEEKAKQALKAYELKCDHVKSIDETYYKVLLDEVNRMDAARLGWCGQSNRPKVLSLNNNFITVTECMYFIRSAYGYNLIKTTCTSNWPGFTEVYLPFLHSLYPYQLNILLNDKNRNIDKTWLAL